ncbi:38332_t:CDS:2 [Gigaspora margarita]|uniref:38332_t:CDS:1 n=1 Tax=Gigaspora margarita TaxID=4874 RepID=A0ABN7UJ71_GIGMA|nr:38332_t:CDS:2 [Gigaspora margarita]
MPAIEINDTDIYIVCNDDIELVRLIISSLREKGATKIHLLVSDIQAQSINESCDILNETIKKGTWEETSDFECALTNAVVVISMLHHEFEKQEKLFVACIKQGVVLFITWDSGMELDNLIRDKRCPRTRLHQKLIDYQNYSPYPPFADKMQWILFQVGLFSDEILKYDISTVTTAFNSPNQFIFINVSVKIDFAQIIAESIVTPKVIPNCNYVVGEFVSHTFLGHIYKVFNQGIPFERSMPAEITEFETTNQLRISGIISARPIPKILYPDCDSYIHKIGIEISFQHGATIYKILTNHEQVTLRQWFLKKLVQSKKVNNDNIAIENGSHA